MLLRLKDWTDLMTNVASLKLGRTLCFTRFVCLRYDTLRTTDWVNDEGAYMGKYPVINPRPAGESSEDERSVSSFHRFSDGSGDQERLMNRNRRQKKVRRDSIVEDSEESRFGDDNDTGELGLYRYTNTCKIVRWLRTLSG